VCGEYRWTKTDQPSGMVVMEVNQLTGYEAVDLDDVRQQVGTMKRIEKKDNRMILYFDEVLHLLSFTVFVFILCQCL